MKGQKVQELTKKKNPNIFDQAFQIVTQFFITSKMEGYTDGKTLNLQMLQEITYLEDLQKILNHWLGALDLR